MALHGTSKQYIVERLEREGQTALLEAVRAGKITAMTAAASLGWVQRPPLLGGSTHRAHRRDFRLREARGELGPGAKMELIYGPSPTMGSYFDSREALQAAWTEMRDELLARANPGRRPQAFYEFEFDDPRPRYSEERSVLWQMNLLSAAERVVLEAEWKEQFQKARGMGAQERREHLAHHDVPAELIREWTAERRRRPRAVRNLTAASGAPEKAALGACPAEGDEEKSMSSLQPELSASTESLK
jgi:hypothetical protein